MRARSFGVVVSGGVLLGMEIAASRVLAPFFGNSLYVWGALIGVVLAGLAIGYWLGGVVADAVPAPWLLPATMALGAASILALPGLDGPLLEAIVRWDPGARLNVLLAAVGLFAVPSIVLAAVTPVAVRLSARSVESAGTTAGRLFALSTAGSIAGTFLTSFLLVPELGTDQVLAYCAAALLGAAAVVALSTRVLVLGAAASAAAAAAVVVGLTLAPDTGARLTAAEATNWSPVYRLRGERAQVEFDGRGLEVVLERDTAYHHMLVAEDGDSRYLRFDNSFQSGMYLEDPYETRFTYTDFLALGLAYRPESSRVLFVGLGGGSAPKRLWRDFPQLEIEAVELDPEVVDVAYEWFELPRDERLDVTVADGRRYLADSDAQYDVVVVDAFYADSVPFHLTTLEFLELVRSRLAPGGVVVTNVIGAIEGPRSRLLRSFVRTHRSVFPTVLLHPVIDSPEDEPDSSVRNVILVATEAAAPTEERLRAVWDGVRAAHPTAPDLAEAIADRYDGPVSPDGVPVLTDAYAPTDALLLLEG